MCCTAAQSVRAFSPDAGDDADVCFVQVFFTATEMLQSEQLPQTEQNIRALSHIIEELWPQKFLFKKKLQLHNFIWNMTHLWDKKNNFYNLTLGASKYVSK